MLHDNGVLSGTTNQNRCFTITVKVTDSNGCTGTVTCTFCIECQPITVMNPAITLGDRGRLFQRAVHRDRHPRHADVHHPRPAAGRSVVERLERRALRHSDRGGVFVIYVTAADTHGCFATGNRYTLTINPSIPSGPCPDPAITPPILPPTVAAVPYSQGLLATGGTPPYTFTVTQGPLPAGLSLVPPGPDTASVIGIPTVSGEMNVIITATDANGCTGKWHHPDIDSRALRLGARGSGRVLRRGGFHRAA